MEVIHLYLEVGVDFYLPNVFRPALRVVVKNDRNFMKLIQLFLKSEKHCFLKVVMQNDRDFVELIHLYLEGFKDYFLKVVVQNYRNFVELIYLYLKAGMVYSLTNKFLRII